MDKPKNNAKMPLLILAVLVVLGGGGFALWSMLKKEDSPEQPQETTAAPPVKGRLDVRELYTEEELQHSALVNQEAPNRTPEYSAVLMTSKTGLRLIEDRMRKIQLNKKDADFLRAKHKVGHSMVNIRNFSRSANKALEKMFALVAGVTAGDYLTYPIYGKYEPNGAALRADIEKFLSKNGQGYNLTNKRHGGNAWWFGSVGLNLMYGNQSAHLHSADQIWWYKADRNGLDFYKLVNGHNVPDRRMVDEIRNGQGVFAAWGMYNLVKLWRSSMDFFDKVTREEAIDALEREGLIRRF